MNKIRCVAFMAAVFGLVLGATVTGVEVPVSPVPSNAPVSPNALGVAWRMLKEKGITEYNQLDGVSNDKWQPVVLPHMVQHGVPGPVLWYRATLEVAKQAETRSLFLHFDGVKFAAEVWLDGKSVGTHRGGGEPFELDATAALSKGGKHAIVIRVEGVDAVAKVRSSGPPTKGSTPDSVYKDCVMWPVGSQGFTTSGIFEPIRLEIRDTVAFDDLFIRTSVAKKQVSVRGVLKNLTDRDQTVVVESAVVPYKGTNTVLTFPPVQVKIAASGEAKYDLGMHWTEARLWSPRDPYLYTLVTTVRDVSGRVLVDGAKERFGFREFTAKGDTFYLNGVPMHALGTAAHPRNATVDGDSRAPALELYRNLRRANINFMRLHANIWPGQWIDVADEVGMPLILEVGFFCRVNAYALTDPQFWKNYEANAKALQKKHRNSPAFCVFSLCNEILHCGGERYLPDCESKLAAVGVQAKNNDPTRPILYDGDMDPKLKKEDATGVAQIVNPHYPMDFSGRNRGNDTDWPDCAWWIDRGKTMAAYPGEFWKWDRKKPLYFGEFLHIQHYTDPDNYSLVLGDDAARLGFTEAMAVAKAKTWSMQIPAYRAAGVSGMCPWVITEPVAEPMYRGKPNLRYEAVLRSYEPVTVVVRPTNRYFYDGSKKELELYYLNDTDAVRDVVFKITLVQNEKQVATQTFPAVRLTPAERKRVVVALDTGAVKPATDEERSGKPVAFEVRCEVRHDAAPDRNIDWSKCGGVLEPGEDRYFRKSGTVAFSFELAKDFRLARPSDVALRNLGKRVGLVGPAGTAVKRLLDSAGCRIVPLESLRDRAALDALDSIVVGKNQLATLVPERLAFSVGTADDIRENLDRFLKRGKMVLVLEQDTYPESLFPLRQSPLTIGHHENGVWTKRWSCVKPFDMQKGEYRFESLYRLGGPQGYFNAAAVRQDGLILSRIPFESEAADNPAAYNDLLDVLATPIGNAPRALRVVDSSGRMQKTLDILHVPYTDGDAVGTTAKNSILLAEADTKTVYGPNANETLVLCGLTPKNVGRWSDVLGETPQMMLNDESVVVNDHPVATGAFQLYRGPSNTLLWYGDRKGLGYREMTPIQSVADWCFVSGRPDASRGSEVRTIALQKLMEGVDRVRMIDGSLYCGVAATLTAELDLPKGSWFVEMDAKGTTLDGIGPRFRVAVDGKTMATLELDKEYTRHDVPIRVEHTPCRLTLQFYNDLWNPETREDRNSWIRGVRVLPAQESVLPTTTFPAASVHLRDNICLDNVRWYDAAYPSVRANMYLAELLHDNDVPFARSLSVLTLNGSDFEFDTKTKARIARRNDKKLAVGTNMRVGQTVEFGADGDYDFTLVAGGSAVREIYPHLKFIVDGKKIGDFQLMVGEVAAYRQTARIAKGKHVVALEFDNDEYIPSTEEGVPHQDRNLLIESFEISRSER